MATRIIDVISTRLPKDSGDHLVKGGADGEHCAGDCDERTMVLTRTVVRVVALAVEGVVEAAVGGDVMVSCAAAVERERAAAVVMGAVRAIEEAETGRVAAGLVQGVTAAGEGVETATAAEVEVRAKVVGVVAVAEVAVDGAAMGERAV